MISAIITTYKRTPEVVKRALDSILSQTYKDIEIIVVDDSPASYEHRQEVKELLSTYTNVRYIQHEINKGACAARNTGLHFAKGEYVAYLDDDDEWMPEKIELLLKEMADETVALVYCDTDTLDEDTGEITHDHRQMFSGKIYEKLILYNFVGSTSFPLIRRIALENIGGFDTDMRAAQDFDVWLRLSKHYNVRFVNKPLVLYHIHSGEQISKNYNNKISGMERINQKNSDYLDQVPTAYWIRHMKLTTYYTRAGMKKKAVQTWWQCVKRKPFKIIDNTKYAIKILLLSLRS